MKRARPPLAVLLSAVLALSAPGLGFYEAAAQVVAGQGAGPGVGVSGTAPVEVPLAGASAVDGIQPGLMVSLTGTNLSLGGPTLTASPIARSSTGPAADGSHRVRAAATEENRPPQSSAIMPVGVTRRVLGDWRAATADRIVPRSNRGEVPGAAAGAMGPVGGRTRGSSSVAVWSAWFDSARINHAQEPEALDTGRSGRVSSFLSRFAPRARGAAPGDPLSSVSLGASPTPSRPPSRLKTLAKAVLPFVPAALLAAFGFVDLGTAAAVALLVGAACVHFRTLAETEAGRLGFTDDNARLAAMKELQSILRSFGEKIEEQSKGADVKTKVSAELVTRSAAKGVAQAFDEFLAKMRAELPADEAAARTVFEKTVLENVVRALQEIGLSADSEETIRRIVLGSGVLADVLAWESKHTFVENLLKKIREERGQKKDEAASKASVPAKKSAEGGGSAPMNAFAAGIALAAVLTAIHPFRELFMAALSLWHPLLYLLPLWASIPFVMLAAKPAAPSADAKSLDHHLENSHLTPDDIKLLRSMTFDLAAMPLRPMTGRVKEMQKMVDTLSRPEGMPRSVLLLGPEGSGKRALVESLSRAMVDGRYKGLENSRILELDASLLIGGPVEQAANQLRSVLAKTRNRVVLFIEGPDKLKSIATQDPTFLRILKSSMERGEITLIVSATPKEHKALEAQGPFPMELVPIERPTAEWSEAMVAAHAEELQARFGLAPQPGLFKTAAQLAGRYLHDLALPGSALDAVERTFSSQTTQARLNRLKAEELDLTRRLLRDIKAHDAAAAAQAPDEGRLSRLHNAIVTALDRAAAIRDEAARLGLPDFVGEAVTRDDVAATVAELSGIPVAKILQKESDKLMNLEGNLRRRVVHQDRAIDALARAVRRARTGLKDPSKPIGSFLFLGPTGVGKTELSKALAENLFDDEKNLIRFDMSEYMEPHSVARLTGTHPGYVGYEEGGQLTGAVKRRPYSVVLLDEVEKAHPDVLNLLLQAMDDGRLTDGHGETVDFSNVIFIMTSNLGSEHIQNLMKDGADPERIEKDVMGAVRAHFRPEFINRLDKTIIFNPLGREQAAEVVEIHLRNKVTGWLSQRGLRLGPVDPEVLEFFVDKGFDPLMGGRPLARAVQNLFLDPLANLLLGGVADEDQPERLVHLSRYGDRLQPRLEAVPAKPVARIEPREAETRTLLESLVGRKDPPTLEGLEEALFGAPESLVSKEPLGIFHPMEKPLGGELVAFVSAATDDPDAKDPVQEGAALEWPRTAGFPVSATEAVLRWFHKNVRCAKSTNHRRAGPHETVKMSWFQKKGYDEFQVRGLPLTRSELLEAARIFENHYRRDSSGKDESWDLADSLLDKGEYGRAELFEIKRALRAVPGAVFGYWSDKEGVTFWLRVPRGAAAVDAATRRPAPAAEAQAPRDAAAGTSAAAEDKEPAKEGPAAAAFRAATGSAPAEVEPLRGLVTRLLDSENPSSVYWGFRTARAVLDDAAFAKMAPSLPGIRFLASDVQALYRNDPRLRGYYGLATAQVAPKPVEVADRVAQVLDRNYDKRLDSARWVDANASRLTPEQSAALTRVLLDAPRRAYLRPAFWRRIQFWGQWPLWAAVGVTGIFGVLTSHLPLLAAYHLGGWQVLIWIVGLAAAITASALGNSIDERRLNNAQEYGRTQELLKELPNAVGRDAEPRMARGYMDYLKGRYYRTVRMSHSSDRQVLGEWHLAAAEGLERVKDSLSGSQRRDVVGTLLARADAPYRGDSTVEYYDRVAPFFVYDLLDEGEKARTLDRVLHDANPHGAMLRRIHRFVLDDKIPQEKREALLGYLLGALQSSNRYTSDALLICEALVRLGKDLPDNERLGLADALWATRDVNWSQDGGYQYLGKPAEFYRTMLQLAPMPKTVERIVSHIDSAHSNGDRYTPHIDRVPQLLWLMRDVALDAPQKAWAEAALRADAEGGSLAAMSAYIRLRHIPWNERLRLVLSRAGEGDPRTIAGLGEDFLDALAALYKEKAVPQP